ncbi:hypothetical protein GQ43DRAFT_485312 [Delitschia confertaspora ATCC 74209]|uniref:AN1-type domain-containing protein n=1 Tax=Delitschia confertaspora ATCC 74209 TaxID=1513339 RepID=A0A9P4JAI2_9PLEO|nr:hypothetical protein GQ43DRAFT_485312 [Delitschia confertaspora ATCC 74209]
MAPATSSAVSNVSESFTPMAQPEGDVEGIGAHCQYCRQLDFLPFKCESCRGTFCLNHRTETAHDCPKPGEWARRRNALNAASNVQLPSKPTLFTHEKQCYESSCKTLIFTALTTGVHCSGCNRDYCLKHRMEEDHDCRNVTPAGARPQNAMQARQAQGLAAFNRLKAWAADKRAQEGKRKEASASLGLGGLFKSKKVGTGKVAEDAALKRAAKGDASVPQDKRLYLYVEASADTTKSKYPTGKFFYNKEWSVGRVLDAAAKSLQVENINNRSNNEEDKLRVFHVQSGQLLKFQEKIGDRCQTGNMIVLLRGVGDPDAA